MPEYAIPKPSYSDTTANGLTKCVIDWLQLNGHQAERISVQGQYRDNSKIVTDVMGFKRKIGSGQWTKGSGTAGTSDISCIINGKAVKVEIKMKDKQSEAQKKYEEAVNKAGGIYFIVRNFDEFYLKYLELIK